MTTKPYDALIVEEYEHNGQKRTKFHNVGTMFENEREGWTLKVHPGMAISGRIVIIPRKERDQDKA